jgi:M6 family metalloprotease-like protein
MKTTVPFLCVHVRFRTAVLLLFLMRVQSMSAVTAEDFGYTNMTVNGQVSLGTRPLVVILAQFRTNQLAGNSNYYDGFVFNRFGTNYPNAVDYFSENSNGRFTFARAGVIGPLVFTNNSDQLPPNNTQLEDQLFQSNIIHRAMISELFPFEDYDFNADDKVTDDELEILIFSQGFGYIGGSRPFGSVQPLNSSISLTGSLAHVGSTSSFYGLAHELSHELGTADIYGANQQLNSQVSMMGAAPAGCCLLTYHLDPWHKMQLGWSRPRVLSMLVGGIITLPAAQLQRTNAPVILWHPDRGLTNFFMLEYRSSNSSFGPGYEQDLASSGVAIWQIRHNTDGSKTPADVPSLAVTGSVERAIFNLAAPDLARGGNQLWGSGTNTPPLPWLDGIISTTRIFVRPFPFDSDEITVEVITEVDTCSLPPFL